MCLRLISIFLLTSSVWRVIKCDEYKKVSIEDLNVEFFNTTYFDENTFDVSVNYNTKTPNTLNIKFDVTGDLPKDIFMKAKLMGRGFGQYNVPTGVSFDFNICNNKLREYLFGTVMKKVNWDGKCPPRKGRYEAENFDPNFGGLPLPVPSGFRLLFDAEVYSQKISLVKLKSYLQII